MARWRRNASKKQPPSSCPRSSSRHKAYSTVVITSVPSSKRTHAIFANLGNSCSSRVCNYMAKLVPRDYKSNKKCSSQWWKLSIANASRGRSLFKRPKQAEISTPQLECGDPAPCFNLCEISAIRSFAWCFLFFFRKTRRFSGTCTLSFVEAWSWSPAQPLQIPMKARIWACQVGETPDFCIFPFQSEKGTENAPCFQSGSKPDTWFPTGWSTKTGQRDKGTEPPQKHTRTIRIVAFC